MDLQERLEQIEEDFLTTSKTAETRRCRSGDLECFARVSQVNAIDIFKLQPAQARDLLSWYKAALIKMGMSASTVNRRLSTIRGLIRYGRQHGFDHLRPKDLVRDIEDMPPSLHALSQEDIALLSREVALESPRDLRDDAIIRLLIEVPLLGWQVCALLRRNFHWPIHQLEIPTTPVGDRESTVVSLDEEGASEQHYTVSLSPEVSGSIQRAVDNQPFVALESSPLFPSFNRRQIHAGSALETMTLLQLLKEIGQKRGVANLTSRTLRVATLLRALDDAEGKCLLAAQRFPHIAFSTWEHYHTLYQQSQAN